MQIQYADPNSFGTAFTIEIEKRQYIITAGHVVQGIKRRDEVRLKTSTNWVVVPVTVIDTPANADIAVLAPPQQITTAFPVIPSLGGAIMAQDVYFLGFPYGLATPMRDFNIAFIKKGIFSSIVADANGIQLIYLDGHNNPGFSGGPIAFKNSGSGEWQIGGVITGYRWATNGVISRTDTNAFVKENTGIVVGVSIDIAVKAIKANPIGPLITW